LKLTLSSMVLVAIGAAILACSDSTGGGPVVTVSAVAAGNGQSARVGSTLPEPLQVQVLSDDVAKPGAVVTWETSSGSLVITSNSTDSNGIAAARWVLGNSPGEATAIARVTGAQGSPVEFKATVLGWVTATIDPATNNQVGTAGAPLTRQLRVQTFAAGAPAEGVRVSWSTRDGTLSPGSTTTDASGWTSTTWVLPEVAGPAQAQAVADRTNGQPIVIHAITNPGPVVTIEKLYGDSQSVPTNFPQFGVLAARGIDRFGNQVWSEPIAWSVQSGPVVILPPLGGWPSWLTTVASSGGTGGAVVRARPEGSALFADFTLTVVPPAPLVLYDVENRQFRSGMNGSIPAVDTIPAGATMTWFIGRQTLYPEDYYVWSVGVPSFQGGNYGTELPAFSTSFMTPGTYRYADSQVQGATGTLVVQ
jgi:hypothetical protein